MSEKTDRQVSSAVLAGLMAAALGGCSFINDTSDNHLQAKEMPPLVVPEDMDSNALGQLYPIPSSREVNVVDDFVVPRPQPVSANIFEETVKIQTFDNDSWILINQPPEEIWPRIRNILNRSGIPTQNIDASTGLVETIWIKFKDDDATSHRFKFSIEPAIQVNSTEVKIIQMQTAAGTEENIFDWPATSQSEAREREMLDIISNALAADISGPSVSLLAQSIGGEDKVELITPKVADSYLELKLSYERAWASAVYSLSRGGFSIEDQNQTVGTLYVDFSPESLELDEEPGFFKKWFSFGNGDDAEQPAQEYIVIMKEASGLVQIRIVDRDQQSLDKVLSNKLLGLIRANLS